MSDSGGQPGHDEHIPLDLPEALRAKAAGGAKIDRPSLVEAPAGGEACPNCGTTMGADAVVCFNCGYDQKSARVVKPEIGVVEVGPPVAMRPEKPEFVIPGRGSARVIAVAGVVAVIAAMVISGVLAKDVTAGVAIALAGMVLVQTVLHTGTGVAAVWLASKLTGTQFERHVDLAAARMLLAFGTLQLVAALRLGIEHPLARAPVFLVACGAYWLALFALFRRSHRDTSVLAACHLGAWMAVEFGVQVQAWLASAARVGP